jgi:hypothetical protein
VDKNDRDAEGDGSGESTFEMDPQALVWSLARALVEGQRTLTQLRRGADSAERLAGAPPEQTAKFVADFRDFDNLWHSETYPMLVASFQLALEVYDTFGPSPVRLTDPIEASIWNNKHHVWFRELSGGIGPTQMSPLRAASEYLAGLRDRTRHAVALLAWGENGPVAPVT